MRDAFGGVFMMRLMLVFIVVFVGFGAISLNYAKAFRIKNKVIDLIEQQEILDVSSILTSSKNYTEALDNIIDNADYRISCDNSGKKQLFIKNEEDKVIGICYRGITVTINKKHKDDENLHYNVITYGGWNLGFLNMILAVGGQNSSNDNLSGRWQVVGEAKVRKLNDNDSIPFTIPIKSATDDGIRCHRRRKWIVIIACQEDYAMNPKCLVNDGTKVLRSDLSYGAYCPGIPKPTP